MKFINLTGVDSGRNICIRSDAIESIEDGFGETYIRAGQLCVSVRESKLQILRMIEHSVQSITNCRREGTNGRKENTQSKKSIVRSTD